MGTTPSHTPPANPRVPITMCLMRRVRMTRARSGRESRAVLMTQGLVGWLVSANFRRIVLGCIRIRIRSRTVFQKKENLGVCAKQKVRLTRLGKYYVVQYYTLYRCAEKSISLFRLPI